MTTPAIEIRDLSKSFRAHAGWGQLFRPGRQQPALAGITMTVPAGQIFGLLGPNGAGKTTLIKVLAGLILPDGGQASINGQDVVSESLAVRQSIGVVYGDERSFYWRLSLLENLRFYASLYRLPASLAQARIADLLARLDLQSVARVRMHALSSGMKQRAAIARGLIHDPPVLFLDEPTRALDPVATHELHRLVRERVADQGRTVLIATNTMREAEELCDRVTLINHGANIFTGSIGQLRERTHDAIVYRLVIGGGQHGWPRGLRAIAGIQDVSVSSVGESVRQLEVTMDPKASALGIMMRYLVEQGAEIQTCTRQARTLDEIFRELVQESGREVLQVAR